MAYQRDPRGPLERLYGFEKIQAARQEMQKQQAMQQQREQILRESYQPGDEARTEYAFDEQQAQQPAATSFAGSAPNIMAALGIADAPQMQSKQIEAKPASFDRDSAINRLYSVGDMTTAQSLVNDDYRQSLGNRAANGGAEKWFGNGKLVTGTDGKKYNQLTSSAGNTKLVPLEGELTGELKQMDVGGKKVWVNSYTGEPVREFDVTATDYQQFQMSPDAQSDMEYRKNEAGARGKAAGEQVAGKQQDATNAVNQVAAIDKIIGLADEGYYSGTVPDKLRMGLADAFGFGADDPRYANTGSIHTLAANLLPQAKPSAMGGVSNSEWDMIREIISDPKKGSPQRYKAALNAYKDLLEGRIAAAEGGFKNATKGYGGNVAATASGSRPAPGRAPVAQAMPSLPSPTQHKGRTVRDTKTGIRYQSNGSQWMRVK